MPAAYKRFVHKACEYYPCHVLKEGVELNCLFCYCPLYHLQPCPGEPCYTNKGTLDCSQCNWIHTDAAYDIVVDILRLAVEE